MSGRAPFIPAWDPEAEPASYLISAKQVNDVRAYMADEINADDCAARLTEPVHGVSAEAMSDAVFAINTFINHSAVLNLSYQPELLSLVQAVQRLPALEVPEPKEDEDGGHISLGDEGQRLWADMPGLGHAWGDDLMGELVFTVSTAKTYLHNIANLPLLSCSISNQPLQLTRE